MELVSPLLQNDFREFCVNYFVLRQIDDIFLAASVRRANLPIDRMVSGQRRTRVEEYYASLNFHQEANADKFLKVLGYASAQLYLSEDARSKLRSFCDREGLVVDGTNVFRRANQPLGHQRITISPSVATELRDRFLDLDKLDPQRRGFEFERFLKDLFNAYGLAPRASFKLVGEQIDGSFQLNSDVYLLEAKWQTKLTAQDHLLIFREKVEGKSTWGRGLFISISGFSPEGLAAFARGRATNIVGMSGQDLFLILSGELSLTEAIEHKVRRAAETGAFFVPVFDLARR
jgi:hypothetical protein